MRLPPQRAGFQRRGLVALSDCRKAADVARRLAQAVVVFDQGDADVTVAVLAEADAGGDRDLCACQQQLAEGDAA